MQVMLCNVNGARIIPRSFSPSASNVLVTRPISIASNGYGSHLHVNRDSASRLQRRSHPRNYFTSPGWTPRRLSSTLSTPSSSSLLLAARGGDLNNDSSNVNCSTKDSSTEKEQEEDIELPFRKYGYRSTPFTWDELDQIIVQEQNLAKLSRSVPQEQHYQLALRQLKKDWKSTKDYILHSKFHFPKQLDEVTQLYFVDDEGQQQQPLRTVVLNDFPYYCAPGIEHWVLWKYGGGDSSISPEDVTWAKNEILEHLQKDDGSMKVDDQVIWWENPPNLKSLPEISHVHLLVRRHIPE